MITTLVDRPDFRSVAMRLLIYLGAFALTAAVGVAAIAGADSKSNASRSAATSSNRVDSRSQSIFADPGTPRTRGATPQQQAKNC
jgi:hypothetical protein